MKFTGILLVSVFCMVTTQAVPPQNSRADLRPLIEQLDKAATDMVKDPKVGSYTIGVVQKDELVWAKSFGYADINKQTPATPDSVYRIGSITKQFTAIMLLQLVAEGRVHLSDPVEKYMPEIHLVPNPYKNAPPITLFQLATHTSGLDTEPDDMAKYMKGTVSEWQKVLFSALPHTKYIYEPGTNFHYSNIGYASLGLALSRAAHQPYTEYVREKILGRLGMTHSDFTLSPEMQKNLAPGFDARSDGTFDAETPEREEIGRGYKVPNGGLYSTVGDLARLEVFEMLGGPESVLPKKELEESFQRIITTNSDFSWGYGTGLAVNRVSERVLIGHSGGAAGYNAIAFVQPAAAIGIIVLHNGSTGWADKSVHVDPNMPKLLHVFSANLPTPPL